ncbi:MAG: ABC-2 transporter permease [Lysinibacillus sp.]
MNALLWHRISTLKSIILLYIVACLLTTLLGSRFINGFSTLLTITILLSLLVLNMYEQDKQSKWALLVNTLPITKKAQLLADFLFCYGLCLLVFILAIPGYFALPNATSQPAEHFAIFAAHFSSLIWLISMQFYLHYADKSGNSKIFTTAIVMLIILVLNFPVHYYLALVTTSRLIILIPTFFSIIPIIISFKKCVMHYSKQDIY